MASKTVVEWVDDIDGEPAAETVTFALDGVEYEIDLSTEHATQLRTALTEFIRKARPETSTPRRASTPVEVQEDEQPVLMPAPSASAESARHLPAPRSAIKSRISPAQLAMDVDGIDEPAKPTRTTKKAAAEKPRERKEPARKPAAKTVAAKSATPKSTAKTSAAKQQTPQPKEAQLKPATPAPEPTQAAQPPAPEPTPAPEPQRPTVASPFSQPTQNGATAPSTKQDGAPNPPMITFSAAKP